MTPDKEWEQYVESMGGVMGEAEHIAQSMYEEIKRLTNAIESAIVESEHPSYGEDHIKLDNYFDAIEILRKAMRDESGNT